MERRDAAWTALARDLPLALLDRITSVEPMSNIVKLGERIVAGQTTGRIVIDVQR
jgi:acrylyl-CoA reductase (NADPH)